MIDTHTHLQFKVFEGQVDEVIKSANTAGVEKIIVVGTNLETSRKAIELAERFDEVFASVGIHPHHLFKFLEEPSVVSRQLSDLEKLLKNPKVVAIGETGLDRHVYRTTGYEDYQITDEFVKLQKVFFAEQIRLAIKYQKSLIIHNRVATAELLEVLEANWDSFLEGCLVFHCCEPDPRLLEFAKKNQVFIGIDGDITYNKEKQEFVKEIPLELLVLETDSPYFMPEPLKSSLLRHPRLDRGSINNEPKNLEIIAEFIANLKNTSLQDFKIQASNNSLRLFNL